MTDGELKREQSAVNVGDGPIEPPAGEKKWYYRPWAVAAAILVAGPLGLPLLWFRPNTNLYVKIAVTIVIIALTVWMTRGVFTFYGELMDTVNELNAMQ